MKTIQTLALIPRVDKLLIELLTSLKKEEWDKPTLAPLWKVKDVAAHLLDGNIRGISMSRDGYFGVSPGAVHSYADLVGFLNELNADWVKAAKRISPTLLITLLEITGKEYFEHLKSLDPDGDALFSVAWAGEELSKNWFHIAREYTEKWHHQQQIRQAVGREEELLVEELYQPFLDTSLQALPYHYREVPAASGAAVRIAVTGVDHQWRLVRESNGWILAGEGNSKPEAEVTIDGSIAWRIFTKGISREEAFLAIDLRGNKNLGGKIADLLAVMA